MESANSGNRNAGRGITVLAGGARRARKGSLGRRTAGAATVTLAIAVGLTAWSGYRQSRATLVELAEENGRRSAAEAAERFGTLESASAANVLGTLDITLDGQLRAAAAGLAMLIEAAEGSGRPPEYIEDSLRQLAGGGRMERIDVLAADAAQYSTAAAPRQLAELPADLRRLALSPPAGRTAAAPATETAAGLRKQAGAQADHRPLVVVVEQRVDSLGAAGAYRNRETAHSREQAAGAAETAAAVLAHALELADEARWGPGRIEQKLAALIAETPIERVEALGPGRARAYGAAPAADTERSAGERAALDELRERNLQGAVRLAGREGAGGRWTSAAAASRGDGRPVVVVELESRGGAGSLVESAWQAEADQLARVDGVDGVWVATVEGSGAELAAAAPRAGTGIDPAADAWSAWDGDKRRAAIEAAAMGAGAAQSSARLRTGGGAEHVLSAAVAAADGAAGRVVVVIRTDAAATAERLRSEAAATAWTAVLLIGALAGATSAGTRRLVTGPVAEIAEAARRVAAGSEPSAAVQALGRRGDEIGALADDFSDMSEQVLARARDLEARVGEKTRWLREANEALRSTQARIDREVGLARTVQEALVPSGARRHGRLAMSARMEPARELGGDFITIDEGRRGHVTISVGDVSGKGVAAALFMVCAQGAVSTAARRSGDVARIASESNRRLCDGNELAMFATGIVARIDTATGEFEYVCAGHEPAVVLGPDGTFERLARTGDIPLGLEADHVFEKRTGRIPEGGTLVIYTDGVTDACNPETENYGEDRLETVLRGSHAADTGTIMRDIWTSVDLFCGRAPAFDDRTVLVIRNTGSAPERGAPGEAGQQ